MKKISVVLDDNVSLTQCGHMAVIAVVGNDKIETLQRMIDGYLNCRPEAPQWLFQLSDALNPVPVPERQQPGDAHN